MIAKTPKPPYYAVIFTNVRTDDDEGYTETARRMVELAKAQKGFLGEESARNEIGITVSYWDSMEAIRNWKSNIEHQKAQEFGVKKWYKAFKTRVARVERDNEFGL